MFKRAILGITVFLFVSGCTGAADASPLVYLKPAAVNVSSHDATPDWAPPPDDKATIDGDLLSRWASNYTDNQWIAYDFGTAKTVTRVVIFWEAAYATDYDIMSSNDNQNWQVVKSVKGSKGGMEEVEIPAARARYFRIFCVQRFNPDWGISIWEAILLGPAKDNPGDKPLAEVYPGIADTVSGREVSAAAAENAVASPGALTPAEFQKGVCYTSWGRAELSSSASDKMLEYLYNIGIRHLGIMVVWMQESIEEKAISSDPKDTPDDAAIAHAINKAHSLGMKVMLKPHVDVRGGQWRGDIIASKDWFLAYKNYILYYARLARQYNVEFYSIGTELVNTTTAEWQPQWEDLIAETRKAYSGPLVYCANWNEYSTVGFWDKLDYVGIDAYFPLSQKKDALKEELISGWKSAAAEIDNWLKGSGVNKPVVFTELGYCSADGTSIQPWSVLSNLSEKYIDQQEQADSLDAMFGVCTVYPWFKGFYWWNYFPQDRYSPLGYTIKGKKAEQVLIDWLKKT